MRDSNYSFPAQNRVCVSITAQLYDRRGMWTPVQIPPLCPKRMTAEPFTNIRTSQLWIRPPCSLCYTRLLISLTSPRLRHGSVIYSSSMEDSNVCSRSCKNQLSLVRPRRPSRIGTPYEVLIRLRSSIINNRSRYGIPWLFNAS